MSENSEQLTQHIDVQVNTFYLEEQSCELENRYVFGYHVIIENKGTQSAILHSRHWVITDSDGKSDEVQGFGVIGQQPKILPGTRFEYTSGAILETPLGTMHGCYHMITEAGERFNTLISPFRLSTAEVVFH